MPADPADQVRAIVQVRADPARAFRVFTEDIDRWWRRGPMYRALGRPGGVLLIEPFVGGRLMESQGDGLPAAISGEVTVWDPPHHLRLRWRAQPFAPHEWTEVDVRFEPFAGGTKVTLVHRGWASIRPDHPARHGEPSAVFLRGMGRWWGSLLTALREDLARA